jgi:signal recognition particle receptor subunit alpha
MCACDTFRAGAVEQLQTHARALNVPLFERGYAGEPSSVAAQGIMAARRDGITLSRLYQQLHNIMMDVMVHWLVIGHDIVLIDTAGRMQGNEKLMRALSKLINTNKPDLVLFVGEALVGNDGVDQVRYVIAFAITSHFVSLMTINLLLWMSLCS